MKKLLVAFASLVWAGFAVAGDYHVNDTLKCSQCHVMHASRSHSYTSGNADTRYPLAAQGTGHEFLLTFATINETCLACHDDASEKDVFGAATVMDRSAGPLNAVGGVLGSHTVGVAGDPAATAYQPWMGHTLGLQAPTPPGSLTALTGEFGCNNCHGVHGRGSFRNLSTATGTAVTYTEEAAINPAYDVTILDTAEPMATKNVAFGFGDGTILAFRGSVAEGYAGMNAACARCHGRFHGADGDATNGTTNAASQFVRHPVADAAGGGAVIAFTSMIGGAQTDLTRPLWIDAGKTSAQVGCLTCHKAHGNARGFGLLYPGPMTEGTTYTGTTNQATLPGNAAIIDYEQGDGAIDSRGSYPIRNLCATCHGQSRSRRSAGALP